MSIIIPATESWPIQSKKSTLVSLESNTKYLYYPLNKENTRHSYPVIFHCCIPLDHKNLVHFYGKRKRTFTELWSMITLSFYEGKLLFHNCVLCSGCIIFENVAYCLIKDVQGKIFINCYEKPFSFNEEIYICIWMYFKSNIVQMYLS